MRTYAEFRKFLEAEIVEEDLPQRRDSMPRDKMSLITQVCQIGTKEAEMQLALRPDQCELGWPGQELEFFLKGDGDTQGVM